MSFIAMPLGINVVYMEGTRGLVSMRFTDEARFYEMLRRGRATLEDVNMVKLSLEQYRPGMVDLRLDDEQYTALRKKAKRV
jgi:hypothetical protein